MLPRSHPFQAELDEPLASVSFTRVRIPARGWLFHAGQPRPALYWVNAGYFRTSVGSDDGREHITAFPMRGDWLGMESLGMQCHVSDTVALDEAEVWRLPASAMSDPAVACAIAACCSRQLREQQAWALAVGSLCAERRVLAFLHDQARRHAMLGCSGTRFALRMTRAEMGNFLALQLETVTRALAKLQATGLVEINRREVILLPKQEVPPSIDTPLRHWPGAHDRRAWRASRSRKLAGVQGRAHDLT
jgi:CRP/FNR family transcriptional regulator